MAYEITGAPLHHRLELDGRERLTVSGVEDVARFDETCIVMSTCVGELCRAERGCKIGRIHRWWRWYREMWKEKLKTGNIVVRMKRRRSINDGTSMLGVGWSNEYSKSMMDMLGQGLKMLGDELRVGWVGGDYE